MFVENIKKIRGDRVVITYRLKIRNAYEAKNGLPAAVFGYPDDDKSELVKVSGDFTEEELRDDYITVNVTDYKSASGYHKLLFTGELPNEETFKDCRNFVKFINYPSISKILNFNGIDEFYENVIKDTNNPLSKSMELYCDKISNKNTKNKILSFIRENIVELGEIKEIYNFEYAKYYFMNELDKLGLTDVEFKYNLMKKHKNAEAIMNFISTIKEDVYVLLDEEMKNIRFVDDLALKTNVSANSKKRIKIICEYNLRKLGDNGCSWVEFDYFLDRLKDNEYEGFIPIETTDFKFDKNEIKLELIDIAKSYEDAFWISDDGSRIASRKYYDLEYKLYEIIKEIDSADNPKVPSVKIINTAIKACEKASGIKYTKEQSDAVKNTFKSNIAVIHGAAGTGKSTVAKAVVETYKGYDIKCVALSGKAALRIGETTSLQGKTMHSTLNSLENGYIKADVIIIDECSMLGLDFFVEFFEKIAAGTTVLILGDSAQLTPIGSGNVFSDLISSNKMNINEITQVHRQALESNIIRFATNVRMQIPIGETVNKDIIKDDFRLLLKNSDVGISRAITKQYEELINKYSIDDVIIVTPYKVRGSVNTFMINNRMQERLIDKGIVSSERYRWIYVDKSRDIKFKICIGDRVINTKNNYNATDSNNNKIPIMNGALGTVKAISKGKMIIDFDFIGMVELVGSMIDDLLLGYAISVHKSQGSQAKAVIYACPEDVGRLGCCEQIYTAVTRAQEVCVVVGTKEAINQCILTKELATKKTLLKEFLDGDGVLDKNLKRFAEKYKPKKTKKKEKELIQETNVVLDGQVTIEEVLPETEAAVDTDVKLKKSKKTTSSKKKLPEKESIKKEKLRERYDKNNIRRKIGRRNENLLNEREQAKVNNIRTVQHMISQGLKNKEITELTGLTKGTVSKYSNIDLEVYIQQQIEKSGLKK